MKFSILILVGVMSLFSGRAHAFHCEADGSPLVSINVNLENGKYVSVSVSQGHEAGMIGVRRAQFPGVTVEPLISAKAIYRSEAERISLFEFTTASSKYVLTTGTIVGSFIYVVSTTNSELKTRLNEKVSAYCWVGGRDENPGQFIK